MFRLHFPCITPQKECYAEPLLYKTPLRRFIRNVFHMSPFDIL